MNSWLVALCLLGALGASSCFTALSHRYLNGGGNIPTRWDYRAVTILSIIVYIVATNVMIAVVSLFL